MLRFRLLGSLEAEGEDGPFGLGGVKQQAVLAQLLLEAGRIVSVETLIDGVWAESPPPSAAHGLRVYISNLRRTLYSGKSDTLATAGAGYSLRVERDSIDVFRFRAGVAAGSAAINAGDAITGCHVLCAALDLWRGPVLNGLRHEPFAPPYVAFFEELRVTALEHRIRADMILGHNAQLVAELEELVLVHPLRESLWCQLMLALARSGRRAEALATYGQVHEILRRDLGVEPGPDLQSTRLRLMQQEAPAADV